MFVKLTVLLLATVYSSLGIPIELEPQHDMRDFLSSRIVGGIEAPPGYGHHMAALVFGRFVTSLICGGSIVTKQHILTAAHCITPMVVWGGLLASFRAVIGSNEWTSTQNTIWFSGYVNHEKYNSQTLKYDIGVLFLNENIVLSYKVAIVPLDFNWVGGGAKSYVTGWGRLGTNVKLADKLQLLYVNTMTTLQCLDGLRQASEGWGGPPPPHDHQIEICTFHSYGHGMCNGDSGSALVKNDTQKQIGIVSWGFPCARGAPDVFVRISGFKNWLLEILGSQIYI